MYLQFYRNRETEVNALRRYQSTLLGDTDSKFSVEVKTTTIDQFCKANRISPARIKIDVQRAEGIVVKGARNTLEKAHPWVLLEFHRKLMWKEEARINRDNVVMTSTVVEIG